MDLYTVTFGANGGSGTMAPVKVANSSYTLPECQFDAPDGFLFEAWGLNGTEYAAGSSVNLPGNVTLIVVWESIASKVPAFTAPADPQEIAVQEGEQGMLSVTATNATSGT